MKRFLIIGQGYVIFIASAGYLFGQLFFGKFTVSATISGICGILAGGLAITIEKATITRRFSIGLACLGGIVGVGFEAYDYYTRLNIPGNSFSWFLIGPYCFCLLFIAYVALGNRIQKDLCKEYGALTNTANNYCTKCGAKINPC